MRIYLILDTRDTYTEREYDNLYLRIIVSTHQLSIISNIIVQKFLFNTMICTSRENKKRHTKKLFLVLFFLLGLIDS
jgi:hypothetical protein